MEEVRQKMRAPNTLYVVEGGDHSLMVSKRQLELDNDTQESVEKRILETIARFVNSLARVSD